MNVFEELSNVVDIADFDGSQNALKAIADAIEDLSDEAWNDLSDEAQSWYNQCADALADSDTAIVPIIPGFVIEKTGVTEALPDTKVSETNSLMSVEDVKEGLYITITSKRNEVVEGEVTKVTDSFITMDVNGGHFRIGKSRIRTIASASASNSASAGDPGADAALKKESEDVEKTTGAAEAEAVLDHSGKISKEQNARSTPDASNLEYLIQTMNRLEQHLNIAKQLLSVLKSDINLD